MTEKDFLNKVAKGSDDFLQLFVDILNENNILYCIVGGLAVNAYAEPVVSLDLDVVVVMGRIEKLTRILKERFDVKEFPNSINASGRGSDLRIQIQTDPRYQSFLRMASTKDVLGYKIPVASIEDVLQGKIWAATDESRRPSKRQKDLADIMRLIEVKDELKDSLPDGLKNQLYPMESADSG